MLIPTGSLSKPKLNLANRRWARSVPTEHSRECQSEGPTAPSREEGLVAAMVWGLGFRVEGGNEKALLLRSVRWHTIQANAEKGFGEGWDHEEIGKLKNKISCSCNRGRKRCDGRQRERERERDSNNTLPTRWHVRLPPRPRFLHG